MSGVYTECTFGFPVRVLNAKMISIDGEPAPDVDYFALSDAVLEELVFKPTRLTGSEVRFIRLSMDKSLSEFGKEIGVRHSAVLKWEKQKDDPTPMVWGTEILIRFKVHFFLFEETASSACDYLLKLEPTLTQSGEETTPITIDYRRCRPDLDQDITSTINLAQMAELSALTNDGNQSDYEFSAAA